MSPETPGTPPMAVTPQRPTSASPVFALGSPPKIVKTADPNAMAVDPAEEPSSWLPSSKTSAAVSPIQVGVLADRCASTPSESDAGLVLFAGWACGEP